MQRTDRFPSIVAPSECGDFWARHVGLILKLDRTWFVWRRCADYSMALAFMTSDHPSPPPYFEPNYGADMFAEIQVENVDAAYVAFVVSGGRVADPLTDQPFGQRRFGFSDPTGLWVDVVQQAESAAGLWGHHQVATATGCCGSRQLGYNRSS